MCLELLQLLHILLRLDEVLVHVAFLRHLCLQGLPGLLMLLTSCSHALLSGGERFGINLGVAPVSYCVSGRHPAGITDSGTGASAPYRSPNQLLFRGYLRELVAHEVDLASRSRTIVHRRFSSHA